MPPSDGSLLLRVGVRREATRGEPEPSVCAICIAFSQTAAPVRAVPPAVAAIFQRGVFEPWYFSLLGKGLCQGRVGC